MLAGIPNLLGWSINTPFHEISLGFDRIKVFWWEVLLSDLVLPFLKSQMVAII